LRTSRTLDPGLLGDLDLLDHDALVLVFVPFLQVEPAPPLARLQVNPGVAALR
jgi:hypothetical protein